MRRGGHRVGSGRPKGSKNKPKQNPIPEPVVPEEPAVPEDTNQNAAAAAEEQRRKDSIEASREATRIAKEEKRAKETNEQEDGLNRLQEELEETVNNINPPAGNNGGGSGDGDDEDEEYFSDEDCDEETEGDGGDDQETEGNKVPISRNRNKYRPPPGSTLDKYLKERRKETTTDSNLETGRCWCPPPRGALEKKVNPNHFYTETPMIYCISPLQSRCLPSDKQDYKDYKCMHCSRGGKLESNGWCYRYQHMFADSVWLLHQRLVCSRRDGKRGCGRTFATFHPTFMEQLPNVITERFPFLVTPGGVGMHVSMMDQFLNLASKGILFTAYCNSINEMKKTKYYRDHCTYLDLLADRVLDDGKTGTMFQYRKDEFVPQPFSPYKSPGQYNGVPLKPGLLKRLFLQVMNMLETFFQESFQSHPDDSEASDHSFKFAKQVLASNRTGCAFLATYDSISLAGMCTFNRFCHTKSNDELKHLIKLHREVRINSGATVLKRTEGDGGGDSSVWKVYFKELGQGIKPHLVPSNNGKVPASIGEDKYILLSTKEEVNNWALSAGSNNHVHFRKKVYYGLDAEWNVDHTSDYTRVISICIPGSKVAVLDLSNIGWFSSDAEEVPSDLKVLLENKKMVPVGVNVSGDVARLSKIGIQVSKSIELSQMARELDPNKGYKVSQLADRYLDLHVSKTYQNSDWRDLHDRTELQHYAALDAHLHYLLHTELTKALQQARNEGRISSPTMVEGKQVQLTYRGKVCAIAKLDFVGGVSGAMKKFGKLTIGKGKSLVAIDRVTMNGARPAFGYRHSPDASFFPKSWDLKDTTIQKLLDECPEQGKLVLAWPTDRMKLMLPSVEPAAPGEEEDSTAAEEESVADGQAEEEQLLAGDEDDDANPDLVYCPRTKMHIDRFHVFDNFPGSRDEKIKPFYSLIRRMVIQGSIQFDLDDWNDITRFLAEERGITDLAEVLDHFHFNREWWYQRVRVCPPPPEKGAKNIEMILEYIENNSVLKDSMTDKLSEYLRNLTMLYLEGKLSETSDVEMYQFDGKDKYGLSKWLRRRGSNRSENLHQKMRVAFGPHAIGAEVGHYLLLLVCYRYNLNTGVRRKGFYNFGTLRHDLVDRIQLRMMQIFGVDVFPNHSNQSLFQPIKGFVAVGVGPLNYSDEYVNHTPIPDNRCRGDILFLAKRMKLAGPPLHMHHPREKKIFNDFMGNNPRPNSKNWHELAKQFLQQADYTEVFPKLPSMLKNYYNKWKGTQQLVALKNSVSLSYYGLLKKLGEPAGASEEGAGSSLDPASVFQKEASDNNRLQQLAGDVTVVDAPIANATKEQIAAARPQVQPHSAPEQTDYVASAPEQEKDPRECGGACFGCTALGTDCGWRGWRECKKVKAGLLTRPATDEECDKEHTAYRRKRRSKLEAARRKKKRAVDKMAASLVDNITND